MSRLGKRVGWAVLACVGIVAAIQLGQFYQAAEQQHASYNYQPAEKPGFRIDAVTKSPTPEYKPSCNNPYDDKDADLCAQWASVNQVAESNRLNSLNLRVLILTLFLTSIGTWALVWTFFEQRRTSRAELRAYLTVEPCGINELKDGVHRVPLNFINNGQTPAYQIQHGGDFLIMTGDPRLFDPADHGRLASLRPEDFSVSSDQILGPKTNRFSYAYMDEKLPKPFWDKIHKKEAAIIHYGFVRYVDAFGRSQATNFAFYHWGEELSDAESKVCRFGNSAT